ncbi:MAG: bifunctional 4-hydroxy-2-oxoglutarate aldolase/2-dehydro-3-deoxy-phosphogluconate aldolase [Promethearchaeota archaeon]
MDVFSEIKKLKIIPVATINDSTRAIPLGKALFDSNLPIVEVVFRTDAAEESIRRLTDEMPNMIIGAGTVLNIEQVNKATNAGAKFIVTPGFNPKVVDYCVQQEIILIPGVNTPSMVEWALDRELKVVKFFPAIVSGGIEMLKALAGPYPNMKFIPTGGINDKNLIDFLRLQNVIACGGSWIVNKQLISSGKFKEIKELTKNAISSIRSEFNQI